ncbi:MAG: carbon-nitrogen hydrolase family protein [Mariprofundaceae bacterium]|nr:carbon-nitrogen hydrolase family protein [Mariprofundaceae bacterium]
MSETLHVACVQMSSSDSLARNLSLASHYIRQAANTGAELILLPENFSWMGEQGATFNPESIHVVTYFLGECAKNYHMWIVAGSILWTDNVNEKPFNRSLIINPQGEICDYYDKIHLFEAVLGHESWKESNHIQAGKKPTICDVTDDWRVGLSICYDLRFPHLYQFYANHGCNILTVPAAFTEETGQAHWQVLLQARAIENQCYVLAAAQIGEHVDGRHTYGHSMIIDPWGNIMALQEDGEGVIHAELSLDFIDRVNKKLPMTKAGAKQ